MGDLNKDIGKYLRGELSPAERHALEKRALSDPFLADALEGADSISMEDFSADLKSLQHSLTQRIDRDEKKVVSLWSWTMRIAAGLLIVAVAGFMVYQVANNKTNVQIAQHDKDSEVPAPKSTDASSTDSSRAEADEAKKPVTESLTDVENPKTVPAEKPKAAQRNNDLALAPPLEPSPRTLRQKQTEKKEDHSVEEGSTPSSQPVITSQEVVSKEQDHFNFTLPDSANIADVKLEPVDKVLNSRIAGVQSDSNTKGYSNNPGKRKAAPASSAPVEIRARDKEAEVANVKVITGKVISADDGTGLPGVNITIKDTEEGTITDAEGNYQITVEPAASALVFSFIGMESQEVKLDDATQVNVAMNQDMTQLSEVVVTGFGMADDEDTHGRITFATPAGGRTAFKKYIESNIQYPEQALVNEVEGRVTIQFTVESSGALSEIKVIRGIGYGCDEEVIRLIKHGPKWNPTRRDDEPIKGRVKVRVRFRLPKK